MSRISVVYSVQAGISRLLAYTTGICWSTHYGFYVQIGRVCVGIWQLWVFTVFVSSNVTYIYLGLLVPFSCYKKEWRTLPRVSPAGVGDVYLNEGADVASFFLFV